jgi:hypothetical protein
MRRKLPCNFGKAKSNKCPVVEAASVESDQPASVSTGWSFSNLVMFSIVVTAMFNKASRVKKAW